MHLKWAIIGGGSIAEDFVKDLAYSKEGTHEIVGVVSQHLDSAQEFAEKFHIPHYYDDFDQLLADTEATAAYIATPHPLHHSQCIQLLEKGIPVLCEKPLGINSREVQSIIETSRKHGVFFMEAMWIRFLPSITKVLDIVQSGRIGKVQSVVADMTYKAPYADDNRYFNPELGGGALLDLGIYGIFLSTLLNGKPTAIRAVAKLSPRQVDESCSMLLEYPEGVYANLDASFVKQSELNAFIFGDDAYIKILPKWLEDTAGLEIREYGKEGHAEKIDVSWEGHGFQFEIDEVVRCLREGKRESEVHPHQASLDLVEIMDEVRRQTGIRYPSDEEAGA